MVISFQYDMIPSLGLPRRVLTQILQKPGKSLQAPRFPRLRPSGSPSRPSLSSPSIHSIHIRRPFRVSRRVGWLVLCIKHKCTREVRIGQTAMYPPPSFAPTHSLSTQQKKCKKTYAKMSALDVKWTPKSIQNILWIGKKTNVEKKTPPSCKKHRIFTSPTLEN